jgi:orotate phosphoribosyltransferase
MNSKNEGVWNEDKCKERVTRLLFENDMVQVAGINGNPQYFVFGSGMRAPMYLKMSQILSDVTLKDKLVNELYDQIYNCIGINSFDVVGGTTTAGIPWISMVQQKLHKPMIFVRSSAKDHGRMKKVEGELSEGQKVLVIEDVISRAETTMDAIESIRSIGGVIEHCAAICDYGIKSASDLFREAKVKKTSNTNLDHILEYGCDASKIPESACKNIASWRDDHERWESNLMTELKAMEDTISKHTAEIALGIQAVKVNPKGYRYQSGILSPIYTDLRLLISYPEKMNMIADYAAQLIKTHIGTNSFDVIAGVHTAGEPLASWLQTKLGKPMIQVTKERNVFGRRVEGVLKKGDIVLLVEDLISTFDSSEKTIDIINEYGGIVNDCIAIFSYGLPEAQERIAKRELNALVMFYFPILIETAVGNGTVEEASKSMVLAWQKDSRNWAKTMGLE